MFDFFKKKETEQKEEIKQTETEEREEKEVFPFLLKN